MWSSWLRNRGLTVVCKTILDAVNDIKFIDEINACFKVICSILDGCSILTGCSPLSSGLFAEPRRSAKSWA